MRVPLASGRDLDRNLIKEDLSEKKQQQRDALVLYLRVVVLITSKEPVNYPILAILEYLQDRISEPSNILANIVDLSAQS